MAKGSDYETYIVVIGRRDGKRYADRLPLNVPVDLARGNYERLSDLQLKEFANDIAAEQERRRKIKTAPPFDPAATQISRRQT